MDDDTLLRSLGALAVRQEGEPDRAKWERVTRGEASPEELVELERLAEEDQQAAVLLAAHRPLDERARARITADLASNVGAGTSGDSLRADDLSARRRARVLRVSLASGSLAVAAAAVLVVMRAPSTEALPSYGIEVSGAASTRGAASAPAFTGACLVQALAERGAFEIFLRPDDAVSGPVEARAFLVADGRARPWPGAIEISPAGALHVVDGTDTLAGASELRIVVGRPAEVTPAAALAKAQAPADAGKGWQMIRCAIAR